MNIFKLLFLLLTTVVINFSLLAHDIDLTKNDVTEIDVSLHINKLYQVETKNQTFKLDAYLVMRWIKPKNQITEGLYENNQIQHAINDGLWLPAIEFINVLGHREVSNRHVVIDKDRVTYNERFTSTFTTKMDFKKFPFDSQSFIIEMEPFSYGVDKIIFNKVKVTPEDIVDVIDSQWYFKKPYVTNITPHSYSHLSRDGEPNIEYSRLIIKINADRISSFYIWQFILPLALIIISSWAVFWIPGFGERLSTSFTLMLTVVAYNFYTSNLLPRLPYTTLIERMVIYSYLSIFAAIILIVINRLRSPDNSGSTELIRTCRWLFPLGFACIMSLLIFRNFML
ncbi:MAG: gamma-aminobutyric-acid receptor subunit beta [Saccharospirillaceae bacterium]|nr:hypothetical protein [Pseudomonadales bacterium]NRB80830.1 gamma-aminobutyric-acid receptor subunit beta [Saccharospirillaceae bacterium]